MFSQLTSLETPSQIGLGVCLQVIFIPVNFTSKINHQSFIVITFICLFVVLSVHLHKCVCALWHTRGGQRTILEVGSLVLPCESRDQTQVVDLMATPSPAEPSRWFPSQPFMSIKLHRLGRSTLFSYWCPSFFLFPFHCFHPLSWSPLFLVSNGDGTNTFSCST